MLSLRTMPIRSSSKIIPRSLFHTSGANWASSSRAQLKKDLIKEAGLKRPAAAFILFSKAERPNLKIAYPDLTPVEISTKLGAKWSSLSEQEKQPFIDQYNEKFKDYKSIVAQLENKLPPKKPGNAYILFVNESMPQLKAEYPNLQQTEILKKIGENWKNLAEHDKAHYAQLYKQKLAEWKQQIGNV